MLHRHPNAKNFPLQREKRNGPPTIDPKNTTGKVEVYHPTKGWRYMSPKRMRAGALMVGPLRGAAIAQLITEGHKFGS